MDGWITIKPFLVRTPGQHAVKIDQFQLYGPVNLPFLFRGLIPFCFVFLYQFGCYLVWFIHPEEGQNIAEQRLLLFLIGSRGLVVINPGKIFGGNITDRQYFLLSLPDGSSEFRFEFIGLGFCS
ncbi:MAG: hypothetical protein ABFD82_19985 [Syntrophaceae bacterium]